MTKGSHWKMIPIYHNEKVTIMPKETFFNLPIDKRKSIEEVAITEFSTYGFDKASINRITKLCGIAKGSFYQYFENKKDVFFHMMELIKERKLGYMSDILMNPAEHDFFTLLREMYISGLKFARANPELVQIGNLVLKNKEHPIYKEALGNNASKAKDVFDDLLELAIARGEVRPDIDKKFVASIISSMNVATIEYYYEEVKGDSEDMTQWDDDIMDTVNLFIDFMKNGIKKNES